MEILTPLILLGAIVLLVVYLIFKRFSLWKDLGIPYVKPVIPYGNLKGIGKDEHLMTRLQTIYRKYKGKTPIVGLFFFIRPVALVTDLELLKHIFIKDFNNFHDRGVYYNEKDDPLSANLFTMGGSKWKLLRTKLTPTFTSGKMKFMFSIVAEIGQRLEKKFDDLVELNCDIEVKDPLARYTTDVIGSCAFGIECNTLNNQNADFRKMGLKIFDKPKFGFVFVIFLGSIRRWAHMLKIKSLNSDMTKFLSNVVIDTMNYREIEKVRRNDFLEILIDLQKTNASTDNEISLNEILGQAFIFFAAGFETSSTLLTFCLYELAINQNIQQKARNHIEDVLKKHNGNFNYESMTDMKYLDQILNETLRLYSPLTTLFRVAENDYQIPGTKYVIQSGTMMAIPVYSIHHDHEIYPNPDTFNPENFNEVNSKNRPSVAFLAFGDGPRNCIGLRFGMMQARVGLVSLLRKFNFSLSNKMTIPVEINKNNFITSPTSGMWLKVERL